MKSLAEIYTKEDVEKWLRKIFSLCDPWDLEEYLEYKPTEADEEEDGLIDYAVDYYLDDVYPNIFDYFEMHPYMSGHDETGEAFFEHEYLFGDSLELDYNDNESYLDDVTEYQLNEVYYLVENGDVVKCMSFHFKSQLVEFTHEYELMRLEEGDGYYLNPYNVCDVLNDIAHGTGRKNNG